MIAGLAVQKLSEHWQDLTPVADRGLPQGAFAVLIVGAVWGAILVPAGIAVVIPSLRAAGWGSYHKSAASNAKRQSP